VTPTGYFVDALYDSIDGNVLQIDDASPRFADCNAGLWALVPSANGKRSLVFANYRFPTSSAVVENIPGNPSLAATVHDGGGVWLLTGADNSHEGMGRGLWRITASRSEPRNLVVANVHEKALVSHDAEGRGVWTLEPAGAENDRGVHLTHVGDDGTTLGDQILDDAKLDRIESTCNAGPDTNGVYLVYRATAGDTARWKVGIALIGSPCVTALHDLSAQLRGGSSRQRRRPALESRILCRGAGFQSPGVPG